MTESLNVAVMENKSSRFPNGNALYSTMRSPAVAKEIHQRYKDLLEPLSLFTPQIKNIDIPVLHLERPVTPIDQNVKLAPTSLSDLCQLIQRRIAARSDIKTVSMATQQELGGIIAADVKLLWEDFELYSHDNALTKMESRELSRRITTHIVTVCEQLFFHYLHMVDIVRQRSVFTDEANLSRLKAQLALDCTKFLNIPSIKRQIAEEIKTSRISGEIDDEILEMENLGKYKDKVTKSTSPAAPFSFKCLFNLSRPKRASKPKKKTIENDLKEINDNMPHLDVEKYYNESLHKVESAEDHRPMQIIAVRNLNLQAQQNEEVSTKSIQPEHEVNVKKWKSSHKNSVKTILSKGQNIHGCSTASDLKSLLDFCQSKDEKNEPFSIAEDLHNLLEISTVEQGNDAVPESTLPPLIEAIMYDESNEIKKCRQQKILKELEEEESELRHSVQPNKPEHAQPDFVSIRLSQKLMARTADVRVSDRQFIDSVYLKIYPPIYNHHQEEFDQEMVKTLDKSLSFAEELQEIYKELLDMIPSDYLLFDEDPIIVPPAVNVDLAGCFPSDTLSRSLKERVINPKLKLLDSDYGTERYLLMKKEGEDPNFSSDNQLNQQDLNINSNDYLKYVLSQGSDFLGVLYHFYESEEEKDEERRALVVRELELKQEEEMQIAETRLVKEKFLSGLWNVNAVMLGGLGKEPLPKGTILGPHDARGRDYKLSLLQMNLTLGSIKNCQGKITGEKEKVEIQKLLGKSPDTEVLEHLQKRLQRIWITLHVPDREQLDMAIKYSSQKYRAHFAKALDAWENAVQLIQERECILSKLEHFEHFASDPNRFFDKGYKGTSTMRLNECKKRDKFYTDLSRIENHLSKVLKKIKDYFGDVVTFKGRPYLEKMQRDKVEMLYWLQQERRKCVLQRISPNKPVAPKYSAFQSCTIADL